MLNNVWPVSRGHGTVAGLKHEPKAAHCVYSVCLFGPHLVQLCPGGCLLYYCEPTHLVGHDIPVTSLRWFRTCRSHHVLSVMTVALDTLFHNTHSFLCFVAKWNNPEITFPHRFLVLSICMKNRKKRTKGRASLNPSQAATGLTGEPAVVFNTHKSVFIHLWDMCVTARVLCSYFSPSECCRWLSEGINAPERCPHWFLLSLCSHKRWEETRRRQWSMDCNFQKNREY